MSILYPQHHASPSSAPWKGSVCTTQYIEGDKRSHLCAHKAELESSGTLGETTVQSDSIVLHSRGPPYFLLEQKGGQPEVKYLSTPDNPYT